MSAPAGWAATAIDRLRDSSHCPVCDAAVEAPSCPACGADLSGPQAQDLRIASLRAAVALARRQKLVAGLRRTGAGAAEQPGGLGPRGSLSAGAVPAQTAAALLRRERLAAALRRGRGDRPAPAAVSAGPGVATGARPETGPAVSARGGAGSGATPQPAGAGLAAEPGPSAPLQSLLSLAGAGLLGIAAIVFSFFTPDLAEVARTAIVAATGMLFATGAVLLARRALRFSAETVAGLALVFGGLALQGVVAAASGAEPWGLGAVLVAAGSAVLLAVAGRARLRIWLWAGAIGLAVAPAMLAGVPGTGDAGLLAFLAAAFVALGEVALLPRLGARFADPIVAGPERASLIAVQAVAIAIVLATGAERLVLSAGATPVLALSAVLVCVHALLAARHGGAAVWSIVAGVAGAGAPVLVALSTAPRMGVPWFLVLCATGAGLGLVLLAAVLPLPRAVRPVAVAGGAIGVLAAALLPGAVFAALAGGSVLAGLAAPGVRGRVPVAELPGDLGWALLASLAIGAAALGVAAASARRRSATFRRVLGTLSIVPATLAVLSLGASELLPAAVRIGILLAAGTAVALAVRVPRPGHGEIARVLLLVAAHLAVALAAFVGAEDPALMPPAGVVTLLALFALGAALPAAWRFLPAGAGFGYALAVLAAALGQAGIGGVALLSLTATAGLLAAAAITALRVVPARSWLASLVVAAVPFAIGVAQVLAERSGWTALPTAAMAVLAVLLMGTRRDGAVPAVRLLAAGVLVPSLAVSVLCAGAQVLAVSASPVVLPVIAALVAAVLPGTGRIRRALAERGVDRILAARIQGALEGGALLTGALAAVLAVAREAAGFGTACLVLALLAAGAGVAAAVTGRRHLRAVAAVAATGALWAACAAAGVVLAEAYLLPPALAALVLGLVRALRGGRGGALVGAGAAGAVVPTLALVGQGEAAASPWRTAALLVVSVSVGAGAVLLGRRLHGDGDGAARGAAVAARRLRPAGSWLAAAAIVAGLAGATQAILLARGAGAAPLLPAPPGPAPLFFACLVLSAAGGVGMALAAAALRMIAPDPAVRGSRWLFTPALLAVTAGVWPAIRRDWFSIWGMWALMLVLLAVMVLTARRAVRGAPVVAPVWVLFVLAFVTAVVAWSPRDLRVEWFSLPLGILLVAAGMQGRLDGAPRTARPAPARMPEGSAAPPLAALHDWPAGPGGSWALLAPGIVVTLLASVVSTFTDPLTWRAILVMACALVAILVGATRRLAAPFLIGLIVLPIENVFVFAVQIGRGIESMPWWITLALMGAVLLIIATTAERRAEHATMTARLRDLR